MGLFDVYSLLDIEPVKACGTHLWDKNGTEYLDLYGGHAVISIGHTHPTYVKGLTEQLNKIGFYSNAVINPLQSEAADKLAKLSGYDDYNTFFCNSGAEANENAIKLASFVTGRDKILAMKSAFHGRTSAAVAATDNPKIQAPVNKGHKVDFITLNDTQALAEHLQSQEYAAVMIEGIQGVGGIRVANDDFLKAAREICNQTDTILILDEIQSGCGRTGRFFAHQSSGIKADIITMAKGIGNGFPVGAMLITPAIEAKKGMLGTTFGGNHLACAAVIAVADTIKAEGLVENAAKVGAYLIEELKKCEGALDVRGEGLMIGVDLAVKQSEFRKKLTNEYHIMTGCSGEYTLRLLPPLTITMQEADEFLAAFRKVAESFK